MRIKTSKRKISNILLLGALLAIIVGIYYNIRNSKAEDILEITAVALDNYGYLENEDFNLEAQPTDSDMYEIELPELINGKKVNEISSVTLVEAEEIAVEPEKLAIEIKENKITLSKEQLEKQKIELEVTYDVAILEKSENGEYQKQLLHEKTEEERNALEITEDTQKLYSKVLKYEDKENGKLVEVRGYLPKDSQVQVDELTEEKIKELFGEKEITVAYDIKILIPVEQEDGTIKNEEINPEEFGETCEVLIQDSKIAQDSEIIHVKDDGTQEEITVKNNEKEAITFEADNFSVYAVATVADTTATGTTNTTPTATTNTITASTLTANDYGGYVSNYALSTSAAQSSVGWRIFHSDGENIYLIADDYVGRTYVPTGKSGTAVTAGTYAGSFSLAPSADYAGWSDISSSSITTKWLSKYVASGYTSTNINMKATAYLLDTNQWSGFANSSYAEYAIGGPTLELFTASYNATHETDIDTQVSSATGYKVKWSTDSSYATYISGLNTSESLYVISSYTNAYGMWVGSPSDSEGSAVVNVGYDGNVLGDTYNYTYFGARPCVSLKSDVELEKQADGTYLIIGEDNEAPTITIEPQGEPEWAKSHSVTVTIEDKISGLAEGTVLNYGWSTSQNTPPTGWTRATISEYTAGATSATTTITGRTGTGKYYLWVKPSQVKDVAGNILSETVISGETFWFDYTAPAMPTITNSSNGEWTNQDVQINVSSSDNVSGKEESGITRFEYSYNNSSWTRDTGITTENGISSISKTFKNQINKILYIRAVDEVGNISGVSSTKLKIDKTKPTITVAPTLAEATSSVDITITVAESGGSSFNTTNEYKYQMGKSSTEVPTGTWSTYQSGTAMNLGSNLSGEYYLWVKAISDIAGNTSTSNGTTVGTTEETYHVFGPYFIIGEDNEVPTITASTLTANDYGGYVTNYASSTSAAQSSVGWRIFHSDGENIYLIADDYVDRTYVPSGKNGTAVTAGTYARSFSLAPSADYAGWSDISSNSITTKWLSKYVASGYTSTNINMKATAYLLDTNQWSGFANSSYAEYAIGGPTLELFTASYNATHKTDIDTQVSSATGYKVKWSTDSSYANSISGLNTSESLYVISSDTNPYGMWVGSPSAAAALGVMSVSYNGDVRDHGYLTTNYGARPCVSLKSDVELEKQVDGTYLIIDRDNEAPTITIEQQGNPEWAKSHSVTVTIEDKISGLAEGTTLQYGWSASRIVEPREWVDATISEYTAGATSTTFTAEGSKLTGKLYLWVKPTKVKDVTGNLLSRTVISGGTFWFDNIPPNITIESEQNGTWQKEHNVTIKIVDEHSGLIGGTINMLCRWFDENGSSGASDGQIVTTTTSAGSKEALITISKAGVTGKYSLMFKTQQPGVLTGVVDAAGNAYTDTQNEEIFWFDNTAPSIPTITNSSNGEWTNQDVQINASSSDNVSGKEESGITRFEYSYDNSTWYGDTADWDGNTITTENGISSISKTFKNQINRTLYIRAVDEVGKTSGVSSTTLKIDKTKPTITVSPTLAEATSSIDMTITVAESGGSGFNTTNEYKYQMGKSSKEVPTGTWSTYQSGTSMNLGSNLSGEYYLWVKNVSDIAGNTSTSNGTTVGTTEGIYHVFGPYIFDNIIQSVIITGEATGVTDGLIIHYDGTNNTGKGHSNDQSTWKDLSGNCDAEIFGATVNDNHLYFDGLNDYVTSGQISGTQTMTVEMSVMINRITGNVILLGTLRNGIELCLVNGQLNAYLIADDRSVIGRIILEEELETGRIYNISATYNGTDLKLYVDGVLHKEMNGLTGSFKNSTGVMLGSSGTVASFPNMNVYSARIYNRALSQAEIKQNLNADRINVETANNDSVTLSFIFAKDIQGFDLNDITVTNGTKGTLTKISNSEYTLEVTGITAEKNLTVSVAEGSYTDVEGNLGSGASLTRYRDTKGPVATITEDATNLASTTYNIKFNEATLGFNEEDITIVGGTIESITRVSSSEYNVVVTNIENETQTFTIRENAVFDIAGNGNLSQNTIIDLTAPTIAINPQENTTWSKNHSVTVTVTDEDSGIAAGAQIQYAWSKSNNTVPTAWTTKTLTGYTAGATSVATTITGTGLTGEYYLWVKPLTVKDTVGNVATIVTTSGEFRFDNTAPNILIEGHRPITETTAESLTPEDYGGYVTNYASSTSAAQSSVRWRIFHSDGENIYLIADDYVDRTYVPTGKSGTATAGTRARGFSLEPYADYAGWSDISSSSITTKWLSKYVASGYTSTNINMKATAYLLDTNQWSGFANSSYAEYAIGGPTLELFTASYNATHETDIDTQVSSEEGYKVKWSTDSSYADYIRGLNTSESLYVISSNTNAYGMWVSSPSASTDIRVMNVGYYGIVNIIDYNVALHGTRPCVSLKSDIRLEKQADGTYLIVEETEKEKAWAQSHNVEVTIQDNNSGLAKGATLQYGWSESNTEEPATWTNATISEYTAEATEATFTAEGTGLTGKYYLWVKPVELKDTSGNSQTKTEISEKTYWFDNTAPTIKIEPEQNETWAIEHSVAVTVSDEHSGLAQKISLQYGWSTSNTEAPTEWADATISEYTAEAVETTFTAEGTGLTGKYYLWLKPIEVKDFILNTLEETVISTGTFWFDNTSPTVTIESEQNETWQKEHSATIKIADEHSGLSGSAILIDYRWVSDLANNDSIPQTQFERTTITAGDKETFVTISKAGLTGKYYLQVKAQLDNNVERDIKDVAGNSLKTIQIQKIFWFDNTAPAMPTITNSSNGEWTKQDVQIDVSSADNVSGKEESGITRFEYSYDNSTWYGDTVDWDGNTITTTNYISSISKTWRDEINTTLYVRAIDFVGNISGVSTTELHIDKNVPTVTANPEKTTNSSANDFVQSQNVTIILADTGSSGPTATGKYYLSTSDNSLENGTWETYTSGVPFPIKSNGIFYLYVETIKDNAGNTSTLNGTLTTINGTNYHRFGPYKIDNTAPNISVNGTKISDGTSESNGITVADITAEDYGGYVKNYALSTNSAQSSVNWRIFHSDGENIYLIADNYIENQYKPAGKNGTNYGNSSGTHGADLAAATDYRGMSDISSTLKSKLLSQYATYPSRALNAMATAYLLDTNVWSGFANSSYADYAIGGPTLELFVDSYNTTNTEKTIKTRIPELDAHGYQVRWSNEEWTGTEEDNYIFGKGEEINNFNILYVMNSEKAEAMYLASPSAYDVEYILTVHPARYIIPGVLNAPTGRYPPSRLSKI